MGKVCPNCKSPIPEEANFCLNCFTNNVRNVSQMHKTQLETFLTENGFSVNNSNKKKLNFRSSVIKHKRK